MNGLIFNIKRFAIHDGPGIRLTFFMKGCPLSCWWCHNPEGISPDIENIERTDRIGDREFRVREVVGLSYSIDDLVKLVEKEKVFIEESGGGITFSGGEPLMQSSFVIKALDTFRKMGIHTSLDTSGQCDPAIIESVIPLCDLFLFDIKHLDDELHKEYTGVSNKLLLSNYSRILKSGADVFIRIPIIPGYNDDTGHLRDLKDFLISSGRANIKRVDLLPYHKTGYSKYGKFGLEYKMDGVEQPSDKRMNELKGFFEESGYKVKIGG
jgi:pyruvate formate lyase activating enzyme